MKFLLDHKDCLKYTKNDTFIENETYLIDENVLIYSSCVLGNSTHLIYLQRDGKLNYILFKDGRMSESKIGKFDTKSNTYSQIYIMIINSKINIFYSYTNIINSNICTLHHVIIDSGKQNKYTIIKYVTKKNMNSFAVDYDSGGNIHLLYNTVSENYSYIFYTYFNPYKNLWLSNPIKISPADSNAQYPMIIVDSKDFVHSAWWEKSSNRYSLKYKRMSSQGKDKYKWQDISLPAISQTNPKSSIFEKEGLLFFKCDLLTIVSKDNGYIWSIEETPQGDLQVIEDDDSNSPEEEIIEDNKALPINDYETLLNNQTEIKNLIELIIQEQASIKKSLDNLEDEIEEIKKSKTGIKRLFFN